MNTHQPSRKTNSIVTTVSGEDVAETYGIERKSFATNNRVGLSPSLRRLRRRSIWTDQVGLSSISAAGVPRPAAFCLGFCNDMVGFVISRSDGTGKEGAPALSVGADKKVFVHPSLAALNLNSIVYPCHAISSPC